MSKILILPMALVAAAAAVQPAHAVEDGALTIRLGAMSAEGRTSLHGRGEFQGDPVEINERFQLGDDEVVPRVEGEIRLGKRHRILGNYLRYEKDGQATLGEPISGGGVTIPAGSRVEAGVSLDIASLVYDFSVVETDTFSLGVQLGAEYAKIEGNIYAESGPNSFRARDSTDGFAPVVGARMTFAPNRKWRFIAQGQYVDAGWGNFDDFDGELTRANALVEYRFTPMLGVHVGYDYFKIEAQNKGGDGVARLGQEFKGPVAGVTLTF